MITLKVSNNLEELGKNWWIWKRWWTGMQL